MDVLEALGPAAAPHAGAVAALLSDRSELVRRKVVCVLAAMGDAAVPPP